jgi:transposase
MEVLYPRCCGLDVHKETVVACLRLVIDGKVVKELRTFSTTTASLMGLSAWLSENQCTHIAMEATGVYWKPVWHVLSDDDFELVLANAAHVKNVPGRKTDVKDADWVSDLLAHGLIRASFVPDSPTQARYRAGNACTARVPHRSSPRNVVGARQDCPLVTRIGPDGNRRQ